MNSHRLIFHARGKAIACHGFNQIPCAVHNCGIAVVYPHWFLAAEREVNKLNKLRLTKRLGVALLALAFCVAFIPAVQAKQLRSEITVYFNPGVFEDPTVPIWNGTISGDINGKMLFWATGPVPAKDLGHPPGFPWQVHFFTEYWQIIDDDGDMIAGIDNGLTGYSNWKYRMNGIVTDADGKYENLIGHRVHMHGQITWTTVFEVGVAIGPVIIN